MEEFPSNAQRKKTSDDHVEEIKTAQIRIPKPEEKKVERVINGKVERRKKPLGKRFKETFIGGDAKSVWGYVVLDVLIPAAKDMIADATSQGVERMLFPDSSPRNRRSRRGGPTGYGYVDYRRPSSTTPTRPPWDRQDPRREVSRRGRATHDFDEIILETRGEAEEVIDRLFDLISRYEVASVADLYELTGITGNYTDNKWGWTDIRGAGVTRVRNGYLLDLPRPEPLD